jgi:hypothetical protein
MQIRLIPSRSGEATLAATSELILVLNCGSSSAKSALFDANTLPLARRPM